MAGKQRKRARRQALPFGKRLVLNQYLLSLFGRKTLEELSEPLKAAELEQLDEDNVSLIHHAIVAHLPEHAVLTSDVLRAMDERIVRHTEHINRRRKRPIQWKYFQYLSLLFTEVYLDQFLRAPEALLNALNTSVEAFNQDQHKDDQVGKYTLGDLNKIAFWSATGSGKTLIMHVNILQYKQALADLGRTKELNRIIVLTPNEGLSKQHLKEFQESGIQAELFSKDGGTLFSSHAVEIIDIHKLRDDMGEKTVAVEAFEGNNLVLVDEGHRGAGGDDWMRRRNSLCEQGFSIEYSATFGQAMKAAGNKKLIQEYARCILFDYSYKFFYGDGYGKDYRILNLENDEDEEIRIRYLTAALLSFYQQLRLFTDREVVFKPFLLERPLWIFVGSSVTKSTSSKDISDIEDILLFLAGFVSNRTASVQRVGRIANGQSGLLNKRNQELFSVNTFDHLSSLNMSDDELFDDILKVVFNAAGTGKLHVETLKGDDGEIALKIGDNEPFGVVNVSNARKLRKLCEEHSNMVTGDREFGTSLFQAINEDNSTVNLLVGAKKFTEGWSSWRVSSMGLMNIGRSEGAQIIQLFGRGVRLKGHGFGLKRSSCLNGVQVPKGVTTLETLNIFGIRADYMRQFNEYLEEEGLPTEDNQVEVMLPVIVNLGSKKLKTLTLPEDLKGKYKRKAPLPRLESPPEQLHPIVVDWYPKIQAEQSKGVKGTPQEAIRHMGVLGDKHIAFMDLEAIYFELLRFKHERAWYNFNLTLDDVRSLLSTSNWYRLFIPKQELEFTDFRRVRRWQELAVALLKKYCDRYYKYRQDEWERPHLQYSSLTPSDGNFAFTDEGYRFLVDADATGIVEKLKQLRVAIEGGELADFEFGNFKALFFDKHLYQPLIHVAGGTVKVSPVALNKGECGFVEHVREFYQGNVQFFEDRELYLLRNMSRGRGIGFFEAGNFHPDFIVWLLVGEKQYITFVDPKGIRNLEGITDPKIAFHKTIKEIETKLADPNVVLNSFIISNTPLKEVKWWTNSGMSEAEAKSDFKTQNVLFQVEDRESYVGDMLKQVVLS